MRVIADISDRRILLCKREKGEEMSIRTEEQCVSCGLPCTSTCMYYGKVDIYLTCDKCGCDTDKLYDVNGQELCVDCATEECKEEIIKEYKSEFQELAEMYLSDCEVTYGD